MSGRDVRRLAARATNMTHEAKRDIVARLAAGVDAVGGTDIYITKEPFQISTGALEQMQLNANVHVIEHRLDNSPADTQRSMAALCAAGCETIVSLGGDGTNRAIVRSNPDIDLIPLSTGTNNVFPVLAEPTVAGMVAGMNARGLLSEPNLKRRVKVLHVYKDGQEVDVGLIDAVLLKDDHVGNLLPFDAERIVKLILTRAEPNAIGMSPIGGFLRPVFCEDDCGLEVTTGSEAPTIRAPLSPGFFKEVSVASLREVSLGETCSLKGPGVVALDGDRDIALQPDERAEVKILRDGPNVIDVEAAMRWAVGQGIMAPSH